MGSNNWDDIRVQSAKRLSVNFFYLFIKIFYNREESIEGEDKKFSK